MDNAGFQIASDQPVHRIEKQNAKEIEAGFKFNSDLYG